MARPGDGLRGWATSAEAVPRSHKSTLTYPQYRTIIHNQSPYLDE